jgi:hypothetical protein
MLRVRIDTPDNEDWPKRSQDITDYPLFPEPLTASVRIGIGDGVMVFACETHGEFACTSRLCAPPPVGSGGSLPSGGSSSSSGSGSSTRKTTGKGSSAKKTTAKTKGTKSNKKRTEFGKRIGKMIADDPVLAPLKKGAKDEAKIRKEVLKQYVNDLRHNLSKADEPDPVLFRQNAFERLVYIRAMNDSYNATLRTLEILMNPKLADPSYVPERNSPEEALFVSIQRILSGASADTASFKVDGVEVAVDFGIDDVDTYVEMIESRSKIEVKSEQMFSTIDVGKAVRLEIADRIRKNPLNTADGIEAERTRHSEALERVRKKLIELEPTVEDVDLLSPSAYAVLDVEGISIASPSMFTWTSRVGVVVDDNAVSKAKRTLVSLLREEGIRDLGFFTHLEKMQTQAAKQIIEETLSEVRDFGGIPDAVPARGTAMMGAGLTRLLNEGARMIPSLWIELSNDRGQMKILETNETVHRARYSDRDFEITLNGDIDVSRHELAHRMEYSVPGLLDLEREFFTHRTPPNPLFRKLRDLVPGSTYEDNEVADPDRFFDPYVGKSYNGRAYEIMSMGVQYVFQHLAYMAQGRTVKNPDTGASALMDTEYIDFVLGAMLTTQWEG